MTKQIFAAAVAACALIAFVSPTRAQDQKHLEMAKTIASSLK